MQKLYETTSENAIGKMSAILFGTQYVNLAQCLDRALLIAERQT